MDNAPKQPTFKRLEGQLTHLLTQTRVVKSDTLTALINRKIDVVVAERMKKVGW